LILKQRAPVLPTQLSKRKGEEEEEEEEERERERERERESLDDLFSFVAWCVFSHRH
jgi:ribosomal protein L12E/L44/L45/RPP1/RPP2